MSPIGANIGFHSLSVASSNVNEIHLFAKNEMHASNQAYHQLMYAMILGCLGLYLNW